MAVRSTLKHSGKGRPILDAVALLGRKRLLVGVPGDTTPRERVPGEKSAPPSNALVDYVMELGDDEHHRASSVSTSKGSTAPPSLRQ